MSQYTRVDDHREISEYLNAIRPPTQTEKDDGENERYQQDNFAELVCALRRSRRLGESQQRLQ